MTKYVIAPDAALRLAEREAALPAQHRLLAPSLIRSQVLAQLYAQVKRGELTEKAARRRLDYLRKLRIRLLGDRVLQGLAWQIAGQFDWPDTFVAEYVALARLQADALVCLDPEIGRVAGALVRVAPFDELLASGAPCRPAGDP